MARPPDTAGPPARIPDPGVRPVVNPPKPTPKPGTVGRVIDALTPDVGDVVDAVTPDFVSDLGDGVTAVRAWITDRHNWVRVSWFLGGAVMFTVGAVMVGERPLAAGLNQVTKPVGSVVSSVYKGGK